MARRTINLRPETVEMLERPIRGDGGFQSLMRRIQAGLNGQQLEIDGDDLAALQRATRGKRPGGFQWRARDILVDLILDQMRAIGMQLPCDQPGFRRRRARVLPFTQRSLPFGGDE